MWLSDKDMVWGLVGSLVVFVLAIAIFALVLIP